MSKARSKKRDGGIALSADTVESSGRGADRVEKAYIEAEMRDPKSKLVNWPPSRGPMPKHMLKKSKFKVPRFELKLVEPTRKNIDDGDPLVVFARAEGRKRRGAGRGKKRLDLSLWQQVSETATLTPEQWGLVGGAAKDKRRHGGAKLVTYLWMDDLVGPDRVVPDGVKHIRGKKSKGIPVNWTRPGPPKELTFDLSYPLNKIGRVTIRPYEVNGHLQMTVGYVLWQLAQAYLQIYEEHERYGVWGHAIDDIGFETMTIVGDLGFVGMGS